MGNTLPPDSMMNRYFRVIRSGTLSSRNAKPRRIRNKLICIAVLFGFSALIMAIGLKTTTSVLYRGQPVGIVESKDVAAAAVAKAESEATDILGKKCSITSDITYRPGVAATNLSSDDLTNAILQKVDGIQRLYVLTVNNQTIGGTENRKDIQDLLVSTLEKNMSPTALSAKFAENLQINQLFVAKGSVPDLAEMADTLNSVRADGSYVLNVVTVEEIQYTAPVSFPTQYVKDDTMEEGQSATLNPGSNGEAIVTAQQTMRDGYTMNTEIKDTKILTNPTPAVVAVGTIPRYRSKGSYIWPVRGPITSPYGYRDIGIGEPFHTGIDIGVSTGTPVHAADGGTVIFSGWYSDYGELVELQHDNGDITRYAHNSQLLVSVGDKVAQGDVIAKAGMTGLATGSHVHFEVVKGGTTRVDPQKYLP